MTKVSMGEIQRTGGHRCAPQSQNQAEVLDFSDKDPEVCFLFMSAQMCEKTPDL